MSRIDELIAELCPEGVEFKELRSVAAYSTTRVDANEVDETTFVGVDNLLPNMAGKTIATYSANTVRLPVPDLAISQQRDLLEELNRQTLAADAKRTEAAALRQSGWTTFESALFTPGESGTT
ncbi:MAG: hypothetical protein BGP21_13850 [Thiobacillus sp. 65-29]|jgi:hypothetical protein|nr:MAG: hypothetical protein BGP21_13850 [Thiobacillus sp. 65-29]